MRKEWRVVSKRAFGTFRAFDEDEIAARRFAFGFTYPDGAIVGPGSFCNDDSGDNRLEWRPYGGSRDDWKAVVSDEADDKRNVTAPAAQS